MMSSVRGIVPSLLILVFCAGCSITGTTAADMTTETLPTVDMAGAPAPSETAVTAYGSVAPDIAEPVSATPQPGVTPQDEEAEKVWSGLFELAASAVGGNSRNKALDAKVEVNADWKGDRLFTYARVEYTESYDDDTRDKTRDRNRLTGGAKYEHDLTERLYIFAKEDLERDEDQDLKMRTTTQGGAGYKILEEEKHKLSADAGIGYETNNYYNSENADYMIGTAAERWEWKIDESWSLVESVEFILNLKEPDDDFRTISKVDLRNQLSKNLFLSAGFEHRYHAEPAFDEDNNDKKKRQDWAVSLKIGWTF